MENEVFWNGNWAWSLPLIVINVVLHVGALGYIDRNVVRILAAKTYRNFYLSFNLVMAITTLLATLLHAVEAGIWAIAYRLVGAIPPGKSALLYSLGAITTYGHEDLHLTGHWQIMGDLEALNGMLLFGLSTAFLYGMIQQASLGSHRR